MSIFTVAECQEIISALKCRLIEDPSGMIGSLSVGGRSIQYRSAEDLKNLVDFWAGQLSSAQRSAAGQGRMSVKVARFP